MDYQVVPENQELTSNGFTSPDFLLQQIVTRSDSSSDKYFLGASQPTTIYELSFNMQGLTYEINNELLCPQQGEVVYGLEALDEVERTGLLGDVLEQLDGLGAINQELETSFDSALTDMVMASHSIPSEQSGGISEAAGSSETETTSITTSIPGSRLNTIFSTTEVPGHPFMIPDEVSLSPEEVGCVDEEGSLEEMVLQDLELLIRKMTKTTRICFRDALNRLAKRSKQHLSSFQQYGEFTMGVPLSSISHETSSLGGMHFTESETNSLDRIIANLMFNEMKCDQPDISSVTSVNLTTHESYDYRDRNDFEVQAFGRL